LRRCSQLNARRRVDGCLALTLRLSCAINIKQPDYSDGGDREPGRQLAVPTNAVEAWREGRQVERIAGNTRPKPRRFLACGKNADAGKKFAKAIGLHKASIAFDANHSANAARREEFDQS
jgi:hypothetical protein